ncbi:hypothetical protein X739_11795 [Mesorhizobium sp. LNHC220B00]|nr:hypothetical protein X739_11795 [Mesorhizobium sp. LNHC220B00]
MEAKLVEYLFEPVRGSDGRLPGQLPPGAKMVPAGPGSAPGWRRYQGRLHPRRGQRAACWRRRI